MVKLWDPTSGRLLQTLQSPGSMILGIAFHPHGHALASAGSSGRLNLWDAATGKLLHQLKSHDGLVWGIAFDPSGRSLASAGSDGLVKFWDTKDGKLLRTLEGHRNVEAVSFFADGRILASKEKSDDTVRLWNCETWQVIGIIPVIQSFSDGCLRLAFHPKSARLAIAEPEKGMDNREAIVHIYELDLAVLLGQVAAPSAHYVNAKVVLVGDTGVGKSGLSLVLNNQPFEATDSTPG
jgi:WD40 repeat protein